MSRTPSLNYIQDGDEKTLSDAVTIACPCGKDVTFGFEEGEPTVLHSKPVCAKFNELGVVDFATYVRKARQS